MLSKKQRSKMQRGGSVAPVIPTMPASMMSNSSGIAGVPTGMSTSMPTMAPSQGGYRKKLHKSRKHRKSKSNKRSRKNRK
jgi:hypothetical protein